MEFRKYISFFNSNFHSVQGETPSRGRGLQNMRQGAYKLDTLFNLQESSRDIFSSSCLGMIS